MISPIPDLFFHLSQTCYIDYHVMVALSIYHSFSATQCSDRTSSIKLSCPARKWSLNHEFCIDLTVLGSGRCVVDNSGRIICRSIFWGWIYENLKHIRASDRKTLCLQKTNMSRFFAFWQKESAINSLMIIEKSKANHLEIFRNFHNC